MKDRNASNFFREHREINRKHALFKHQLRTKKNKKEGKVSRKRERELDNQN